MIQLQVLKNKNRKVTPCTIDRFQVFLKVYCTASIYDKDVWSIYWLLAKFTAESKSGGWGRSRFPPTTTPPASSKHQKLTFEHTGPKWVFLRILGNLLLTPQSSACNQPVNELAFGNHYLSPQSKAFIKCRFNGTRSAFNKAEYKVRIFSILKLTIMQWA